MAQPQPNQQQQSLSSSLWSPGRAITGGELASNLNFRSLPNTNCSFSTSHRSHANRHRQGQMGRAEPVLSIPSLSLQPRRRRSSTLLPAGARG
jgi:hypothetical protein